ncbi:hypothetical protein G9464_00840 [Halostella sp. JP-L12]|uniref:DUF7556 family protein n=1 Tax=Halostella TaxID=1843185 RepID=UPI0013CE5E02|nr:MULTISPECIES: hypothetical protein [Halostella]NHN46145.1 hypothetical protein [Halostella sp. JP-L12]
MATDASGPNDGLRDDGEVIAAVDGDGTDQEYVIADISEDEAWLSVRVDDAPTLPAWR